VLADSDATAPARDAGAVLCLMFRPDHAGEPERQGGRPPRRDARAVCRCSARLRTG